MKQKLEIGQRYLVTDPCDDVFKYKDKIVKVYTDIDNDISQFRNESGDLFDVVCDKLQLLPQSKYEEILLGKDVGSPDGDCNLYGYWKNKELIITRIEFSSKQDQPEKEHKIEIAVFPDGERICLNCGKTISLPTPSKRVEPNTKEIKLSQGKVSIIDEEDFDKVSEYDWYATEIKFSGKYYARRTYRIDNKVHGQYLHSFILGNVKGLEIDHINGDTLDNRKCNLRHVTRQHNQWNHKKYRNNKSEFIGVHTDGRKWIVQIKNLGTTIYLGRFEDKEKAARAYDKKAKELRGDKAKVNFSLIRLNLNYVTPISTLVTLYPPITIFIFSIRE